MYFCKFQHSKNIINRIYRVRVSFPSKNSQNVLNYLISNFIAAFDFYNIWISFFLYKHHIYLNKQIDVQSKYIFKTELVVCKQSSNAAHSVNNEMSSL